MRLRNNDSGVDIQDLVERVRADCAVESFRAQLREFEGTVLRGRPALYPLERSEICVYLAEQLRALARHTVDYSGLQ